MLATIQSGQASPEFAIEFGRLCRTRFFMLLEKTKGFANYLARRIVAAGVYLILNKLFELRSERDVHTCPPRSSRSCAVNVIHC